MEVEELKQLLKDYLQISAEDGHYPNDRRIEIRFDGELITSVTIDVVQKSEYGAQW